MLDGVPFAGGRGQMAHGNRQTSLIGQLLQLLFPEPIARPIGATSISEDEQLFTGWIEVPANVVPPPSDALYRKCCSLMIDPNVYKAAVLHQIVDPIRDGFPIGDGPILIHINGGLLSSGLPFSPVVLEISDQLFFLTINRNDRLPFGFPGFACAIDVLKLGVPICMRYSLDPHAWWL